MGLHTPAGRGGLMAGDVLLEVAGQSVVFLTHAQVERNATILPRVVYFIYVRNATIFLCWQWRPHGLRRPSGGCRPICRLSHSRPGRKKRHHSV
jgi:hypothetical protein